jgi:hypothetical protein
MLPAYMNWYVVRRKIASETHNHMRRIMWIQHSHLPSIYVHVYECDNRLVLDRRLDLLDTYRWLLQVTIQLQLLFALLQFTRARTKVSQSAVSSPVVAWWQIPAMSSAFVLTFLPAGDDLTINSLSMSKFCYDRRSVGQSVLVSSLPLGPKTRFLLPSDSWEFVNDAGPLWWEDGYVVYNCCWSSPAQSLPGPSPAEFMTIFYYLRFKIPLTWKSRSRYLYPSGRGWPSYAPSHCVPFSSPPLTRRATVESFESTSTRAIWLLQLSYL